MRILLINHYVGGGGLGMEYRPYCLAKEWVKQGHQVYLLGASFSHLRLKNPDVKRDFTLEVRDGLNYIWVKTPSYNSSLKRVLNMALFVSKLQSHTRKIAKSCAPDLVIASSTYPLDIYPAKKIAELTGAKLCYEVHDLWPMSPMLIGGYSEKHPFIRIMQKAENDCYKYSDKVVSLLWNAEEHMREHGLAEGKFVCVPNGYDPEDWTNEKRSLPLPDEHQKAFKTLEGKVIVGFAGGFAASGALMTLIETAVLLKNNERIHFVLVGKGPEEDSLRNKVKTMGLNNVTFLPAVSKNLIPSVISHFDIGYMGGIHSELHKYGTSYNKMTDYMLSGIPILQAIDEPGSVVNRMGCGIQVEAESPCNNAKAIQKIVNLTIEERSSMGNIGRNYAIQNLTWMKLSEVFIEAF